MYYVYMNVYMYVYVYGLVLERNWKKNKKTNKIGHDLLFSLKNHRHRPYDRLRFDGSHCDLPMGCQLHSLQTC